MDLQRQVLTITLEDIAAYCGIPEEDVENISEADFIELGKRIADGVLGGFGDVAEAAWDCVLLEREQHPHLNR